MSKTLIYDPVSDGDSTPLIRIELERDPNEPGRVNILGGHLDLGELLDAGLQEADKVLDKNRIPGFVAGLVLGIAEDEGEGKLDKLIDRMAEAFGLTTD